MRNKEGTSIVARPKGYSVEEVRQSLEDNLGKPTTTREAEQHIQIHGALTNAAYSRSVRAEERKPPKGRLFSLDSAAADDGASKDILEWGFSWEQVKDGSIQASAGDHYNSWKELGEAYDKDIFKAAEAIKIMGSIKSDLKEAGIIAGTILDYIERSKNYLSITHHPDCQYESEIQIVNVKVPSCNYSAEIEEFASRKYGGMAFLQKAFDTKDNLEEMIKNLGFISGMTSDNIIIFLPDREKTEENPLRVMHFTINGNYLLVSAVLLDVKGRSRGFYPV